MPEQALLATGFFIAEQLLRRSPAAFLQLQEALAKKDVTVAEIKARRKIIEGQRFEELVPNSQLPPETDTPQAPPGN